MISCEKEIVIEVPDNDPKLVINSYLSPGMDVIVDVTASIPLYTESTGDIQSITTASVRISTDQTNWQFVPFDLVEKKYVLSKAVFSIAEGGTYYIEVSAAGFKTAKGTAYIPIYQPVSPILVSLDTISYDYGSHLEARFKFVDIPNQSNYYAVKAFTKINANWSELNLMDEKPWVFSDKNQDGREISLNFSEDFHMVCDSVKFVLYQTTEAFYRYEYSLFYYTPDNPFTEPTPVYTNITNGLGAINGFSKREYLFLGLLNKK